MSQLDFIFSASSQVKNLERVKSRIGGLVYRFFRRRWIDRDYEFHASNLCQYIWCYFECAPESPGRIMRQLRLDGLIDYEVVNRAKALYKITKVEEVSDNDEARVHSRSEHRDPGLD